MSKILKIGMIAFVAGVLAAPVARAQQNVEGESANAGEVGSQQERSFDETRDFMKKHSDESKKTGKM